ncbi:MAG: hypothetical protein KF784_06900 [Fimbriimonadaceae bacterium]|nr:hypothetical protein [Fimbriimonadaceae bacterium]
MQFKKSWKELIAASMIILPVAAVSQAGPATIPDTKEDQATESKPIIYIGQPEQGKPAALDKKKEVAKQLQEKTAKIQELKDRASEVTKSIGAIASGGNLTTSQDALEAMKKLVNEMAQITELLQKLSEDVESIKGWIEGQNEALPIMTNDINDLKRTKWGSYIQTQYRDTNQRGGATDAFSMRRVRIGITQTIDSKTSLKYSFDVATGTTNTTAQLKDAFLIYDIEPSLDKVGIQVTAGQQALPLGYELERSSSEREFPERALYNQRMFNGERGRGVNFKYGLTNNSYVHAGVWDALSFTDPEQSSLAPGPENRLGVTAGLRHYGTHHDVGITMFRGERPKFVTGTGMSAVTHPRLDREFIYLDGTYVGLFNPNLFIRGELMMGKDRVPVTGTPSSPRTRTEMSGYQLQLGYNVNYRNQINFRYEQFDPNLDTGGNVVKGYGVSWLHYLNPTARFMAAYEVIEDATRLAVGSPAMAQQRYHILTFRLQFRF